MHSGDAVWKGTLMDIQTEQFFVHTYITKSRQDRLLYELNSPQKRRDGIRRFCHCTMQLVKSSMMRYQGKDVSILQNGIDACRESQCYVISEDSAIDDTWQDRETILSQIIGKGGPSIAIFKNFVVIETEQIQGAAEKFLLGMETFPLIYDNKK